MVEFTIPVRPRPKQRPRKGKYGNMYTPRETQEYERIVAWYALDAMKKARIKRLEGRLGVDITFYFKDGRRPDIDNCIKAILDGMEGVVYKNDKIIVQQFCRIERDKVEYSKVKVWKVGQ